MQGGLHAVAVHGILVQKVVSVEDVALAPPFHPNIPPHTLDLVAAAVVAAAVVAAADVAASAALRAA